MRPSVRDQYLRLKQPFPGALLLFRLGDFYECYDADARVAARALDLTLTARDFGDGTRIPMCAVPHHAAERQIKQLVARGYKVAIAEQIGDPHTSKGLVDREVVRVVSPAARVDTHCCLPSTLATGPEDAEPNGHDEPPATRERDRSVTGTKAGGARQGSAIDQCETGRVVTPAVQLSLFDLSMGGGDRGR